MSRSVEYEAAEAGDTHREWVLGDLGAKCTSSYCDREKQISPGIRKHIIFL